MPALSTPASAERCDKVRPTLPPMSSRLEAVPPQGVLEHIGPGADLIVPLANGEPVDLLDAIEARAGDLDGVRVHQMHALHDRPYLHGAFGIACATSPTSCPHVTRPLLPGRHDRPRSQQLQRDARTSCRSRTRDPLVLAARLAARPPRLLQPRAQRRLRRVVHRASPLLPRGQRADAADVRPQPDPRQPGRRMGRGRLPAGRGAARRARASSTSASPRTSPSASPTGRRSRPASGRSRTRSSPRCVTTATSASTPSCSRTA